MISDFGLARELGGPVSNLIEPGIAIGHPALLEPGAGEG